MISVRQGSILDSEADCIVNPANSHLAHGGGLARVIALAAMGPPAVNPGMDERDWHSRERLTDVAKAWAAEQRDAPLVPTGGACVTSAGVLPFKAIIHAVGPVWGGGGFKERELLFSAHAEAVMAADHRDFQSIAFPAISCGVFGYPPRLAAPVAISAAMCAPIDVEFWLFSDEHLAAFRQAWMRADPRAPRVPVE